MRKKYEKLGLCFLIFFISLNSFAFTNPGMGFLFPDTEPLGKRNSRFNFVEIVYMINYAYGLTDSLDLEIGAIALAIGNAGFRWHTRRIGKWFNISFTGKAFFLPDIDNDNVTPGLLGVASFSFQKKRIKVTLNGGYAGVYDMDDGFGITLLTQIGYGEDTSFVAEIALLRSIELDEDTAEWILGGIIGSRLRRGIWIVDFGLAYPFYKKEKWYFPIIIPMLNIHLVF
jgi:hypothetical protein